MPHSIPMETAYMMKGGVGSVWSLKQYTQTGLTTVSDAKSNLVNLQSDHSCMHKWFPREKGWAFVCVYGAAGSSFYDCESHSIIINIIASYENNKNSNLILFCCNFSCVIVF